MCKRLAWSFVCLVACCQQFILAQVDSSRAFACNQFLDVAPVLDSSLLNLHHTFGAPNTIRYSSLGNLGLPTYTNLFQPADYFGFSVMPNLYAHAEFPTQQITLTDTYKPHTDLLLSFGSRKESTFGYEHIQNFGKYFHLSSALRTARTEAFYKNQSPRYISFRTSFRFTSPNRKFTSVAQVVTNRVSHKENGGVDTASIYTEGVKSNTEVIASKLNNATMSKYSNAFSIMNYWHLNSPDSITDSSMVLEKIGYRHLYHSFHFNEEWFRFNDSNEVFSPKPDTSGLNPDLHEFTYHHRYENSFGYLMNQKKSRGLSFLNVFLNHQYHYLNQTSEKRYFHNLKVQADATYQLATYQLQVNSSYFLAGYNANDFQAKFSLGKSFSLKKEMLLMQLYLMQQQSMPMYQFSHMASKRFIWDNSSFSKMGVSEVGLQLTGDRTKVKLAYSNIQNYCFINQLLEAQQSKVTQQLVSVQVKRRFTLHKLNLIPTLYYQKNLATEDVLRLPQLGGNVRAFFEGYLFKHATLSQAGIELSYIQAYKANGYAPLLNQFYLQDSVFTANYPQLDVFFNFKIRTVRVFVKVSNALDGIYPTKVYTQVPGYPMYGRIVRLGVVWRFMD